MDGRLTLVATTSQQMYCRSVERMAIDPVAGDLVKFISCTPKVSASTTVQY